MDPNKNLADQRRLAARIILCMDKGVTVDQDAVIALAMLVENLDAWLKNGGFLPDEWRIEGIGQAGRTKE